jgi:tRNA pseudouridine55 synthase
MLDATKAYDFTIRFGAQTDTLDAEGKMVATSDVRPAMDEIETVLPRFTGEIEQVPPVYSALKIGGKAAYARARAGENIDMKARRVSIYALEIRHAEAAPDQITLSAVVSKGTYIRSLARDIADALGTVGHISYLRRTRAGPFGLDRAVSLDFLQEMAKARQLDGAVVPLEAALDDIPALPVTPGQAQLLRHGQRLAGFPEQPGLQLATSDGRPVALVEAAADGLRVVRGFNL